MHKCERERSFVLVDKVQFGIDSLTRKEFADTLGRINVRAVSLRGFLLVL